MGFSYRKSVKMGPFRVTASKSGVSYSVGIKGARVTKRANGKVQTTLSVPGTGLRYTTTSGGRKRPARRATGKAQVTTRTAVSSPKHISRSQSTLASPKQKSVAQSRPVPPARLAPMVVQPRAAKPVRLHGRRSSAQPQIAAPWLLPSTIKGNLATVTVHQGGIHIERTRAGKINGNHSADIAWQELVGIDFLDPNFFRNGHVHFATAGDVRGLTSTGNGNRIAASARNPHAILFAWHQSRAYRQLRGLLTGTTPVLPPGPRQ